MKIRLEPEDLQIIAEKVADLLGPYLFPREDQRSDALVDTDCAASILGTSKSQIYQWVHNSKHGLGDFPFQKAGKGLRFSKRDILEWTKRSGKALETG